MKILIHITKDYFLWAFVDFVKFCKFQWQPERKPGDGKLSHTHTHYTIKASLWVCEWFYIFNVIKYFQFDILPFSSPSLTGDHIPFLWWRNGYYNFLNCPSFFYIYHTRTHDRVIGCQCAIVTLFLYRFTPVYIFWI